jgi:thymidine kinase
MIGIGRLELIIGNMFSGKSTELIRRINREKSINKKILVINYISDNRYSVNSVATHDNNKVLSLKLENLSELIKSENLSELINTYDSFFIDEAQFFSDLYSVVLILVDTYHKHVVVSGLDGDASRNTFGQIISLIPICDKIDKLTAYCNICKNGTSAPFTKKCGGSSTEVIDIGGIEKYIPVCRKHYNCV